MKTREKIVIDSINSAEALKAKFADADIITANINSIIKAYDYYQKTESIANFTPICPRGHIIINGFHKFLKRLDICTDKKKLEDIWANVKSKNNFSSSLAPGIIVIAQEAFKYTLDYNPTELARFLKMSYDERIDRLFQNQISYPEHKPSFFNEIDQIDFYYKATVEDDKLRLAYSIIFPDFVAKKFDAGRYMFSIAMELPYGTNNIANIENNEESNKIIELSIVEYDDSETRVRTSQNASKEELLKLQKYKMQLIEDNYITYLPTILFLLINYFSEHRSEQIQDFMISDTPKNNVKIHQTHDNKSEDNKQQDEFHVINLSFLDGVTVTTKNKKLRAALTGRKNRHLADSWNVRGHYRHLKSGRVVYVKPYVKGNDKSKRIRKIYNCLA